MKKLLLATVAVAFTAPAFADPADNAIKARRGYFQLVAANFGPIVAMVKGEVDYDAERAAALAGNMQALSDMHLMDVIFTEGSDNGAKPGDTRAIAEIWSDPEGFAEKFEAFGSAVDELAAAAGEGHDQLRGAFRGVGASCKGCHDNYRAESF